MNWKTLGKAALVTCGVFVCIFLIFTLVAHFPWTLLIFLFVFMLCVSYKLLANEDFYSDSDRMQWFSSREDEEEEEE